MVKKNADKFFALEKSLKGYTGQELLSFNWSGIVSLMVLADYGYVDLESDLNMDCLPPRWKKALKIADSTTEPFYEYVAAVCFFVVFGFLRDYGHFTDKKDIKRTIDEAIEKISKYIISHGGRFINNLINAGEFTGLEKKKIKSGFRDMVYEVGMEMGSAAYDCMSNAPSLHTQNEQPSQQEATVKVS